jgi:hypothetical protein
MGLFEVVQQHLHILPTQNLVSVPSHRLGEVRHQDRRGIDHRVTVDLGVLALVVGDPDGRQLKDRFHRGSTLQGHFALGRVHGQPVARHKLTFRGGIAFQQEPVLVGPQLQVVPQPNRRH